MYLVLLITNIHDDGERYQEIEKQVFSSLSEAENYVSAWERENESDCCVSFTAEIYEVTRKI